MRSRSTVIFTGALTGGLLAIVLLALFAGRFSLAGVGLADSGRPQLAVTSGALYLGTVLAALIGGAIVAVVAYGAGLDDDETKARFRLGQVMPFALLVAVAAGYSLLRAGLGIAAEIANGIVTVPVASLALASLIAGLVAGAVVAWVVTTLSAKSVVGLEGEAAPASTVAMMKAATRAVTTPITAIVVIAALAIALSQVLLAAEGTAAIAIFGGAAAVVLLGATAAAYLGGPSNQA